MSLTPRTWTECAFKWGCADDVEDTRTCGHEFLGTGYANDHINSNKETLRPAAANTPPTSSNPLRHPTTPKAYPSPQISTTQRKSCRLKGKPEKTRETTRTEPTQPPYTTADGLDGLWANVARIFFGECVSERSRTTAEKIGRRTRGRPSTRDGKRERERKNKTRRGNDGENE